MHVLSSFFVAVESLIDAINIHCVFSLQVNATSPGLKHCTYAARAVTLLNSIGLGHSLSMNPYANGFMTEPYVTK